MLQGRPDIRWIPKRPVQIHVHYRNTIYFAYRAGFNWVSKVNMRLLWFCFTVIGSKNSRNFLNQSNAKLKPIVTWSHAFSRAWRRLYVFASSSDWLLVLLSSLVIGQSDYFGLGFTTLNWNPLSVKNITFKWNFTMNGAHVKVKANDAFKYAALFSCRNSVLRISDTLLIKDFSQAYSLRTCQRKDWSYVKGAMSQYFMSCLQSAKSPWRKPQNNSLLR